MNKFFAALTLATILAFPFLSFAMTPVADSDLSTVTGQAGVSINLDLAVDLKADSIAWGDADGLGASTDTDVGWVGIKDLEATGIRVRLRSDLPLSSLRALTIDVATGKPTNYSYSEDVTFVRLGLGTFELSMASLDAKVAMGPSAAGIPNLNQELGSVYIGKFVADLYPGAKIDIYKRPTDGANNIGLGIGWQVQIDKVSFDDISWGDADGVATINSIYDGSASTTAGYVGLTHDPNNPTGAGEINGIWLTGKVTIDVATSTGASIHPAGTTFVRIGSNNIGSTNIFVGFETLDALVALGKGKDTLGNSNNEILGSLYMKNTNVHWGGYVDISAPATGMGVILDFDLHGGALIGTLAWGDSDGIGPGSTAGYVGLLNAGITAWHVGGQATVDVATSTGASIHPVGTTFVRIGFNSLELGMTSMQADVALGSTVVLNQYLGRVALYNLYNTTVEGYVDIHAPSATQQGIVLDLNVTIPTFSLSSIAWGDQDGFSGANNAGYIGLKNLTLTNLVISGPVAIDVATVLPTALDGYAIYSAIGMSDTFVHIALGAGDGDVTGSSIIDPVAGTFSAGTLGIKLGTLAADVCMGYNPDLRIGTPRSTLGKVYESNLLVGVNGWVDIAAH